MGSNTDQANFYRYEERIEAPPLDEFENPIGTTSVSIREIKFWREAKTPKGSWIRPNGGGPRYFVRDEGKKRYAWPTKAEALTSFIERKESQRRLLRKKLAIVDKLLAIANKSPLGGIE